MTIPHPQAALLRIAADDKDAMFYCDEIMVNVSIQGVLNAPEYNWRVADKPKPKENKYLYIYGAGYGFEFSLGEKEGNLIGKIKLEE